MNKRVALYCRVSTADGKTVDNQLRDLRLAAERFVAGSTNSKEK